MPGFTSDDAKRHTRKATTGKSRRQWAHVAESAMARGASEGSAIRQANSVIKRSGSKSMRRKRKSRRY